MQKILSLLVIALSGFTVACADMKMPEIPNIFSSSSEVSEVYLGQFPDIPIPRDMTLDNKRTLVSTTQDGVRIGLETYEGRVDLPSLARAMAYNMTGRGWTLKGQVVSTKTVQIYEKDSRVVAVYFYPQTIYSAMEIWVLARLQDGLGFGNIPSFEQISPNIIPNVPMAPGALQSSGLSQ